MLQASDLTGVDNDLALRIVAVARSIAPCLDSLPAGESLDTAHAILRGVAQEAKSRGPRHVKSQRVGPAAVEYGSAESWFSSDDRVALRSLCGATASANAPVGRFPKPGRISGLWPEQYED